METKTKEELIALISYLINHNIHHNDELKELADSLKEISLDAYPKIIDALKKYNEGNEILKSVIEELKNK